MYTINILVYILLPGHMHTHSKRSRAHCFLSLRSHFGSNLIDNFLSLMISDGPPHKKRSRGGKVKINKTLRGITWRQAGYDKPAAKQLLDLVKERWPQTKELLDPAPPVEYDDSGANILLTTAHFKHLESVKFAIETLVDECRTIIALERCCDDDDDDDESEGESCSAQPFQLMITDGTATEPEGGASAIEREGESCSARPFQHDDGIDGTATEPEGEPHSAQPAVHFKQLENLKHLDGEATSQQYDGEATSQREGESYSARPARPPKQQRVFAAASSSSIAPASQIEANIESEKTRPSGNIDERRLLKPLSEDELDLTYGLGFRLLSSMGYKCGIGVGARSSKGVEWAGIPQPLSTATPQEALTKAYGRRGVTEAEAKTRQCSMVVDPPECQYCQKCIWPARMSHKSRTWSCYECDPSVPPCVFCKRVTWDGYTLSPKDGGAWMCSECWSTSVQPFQNSWQPWFEERRNKFPGIADALARSSSSDNAGGGSKIRDFVWDLSRLPASPKVPQEYSLSLKNLRRLAFDGHTPDEPADTVDPTFLKTFLATRPIPPTKTKMADSTLQDPTERIIDGVAHYRFARKLLPREALHRQYEGWRTAFHWTPWHCIYSILCNGCKNGRPESTKKGKIGGSFSIVSGKEKQTNRSSSNFP